MKAKLFITASLSLLLLSSCNYFKNHKLFSKDVDSILDMTIEQPETIIVDSSVYIEDDSYLDSEVVTESKSVYTSGSDKYFMIVGSFQNQNLADTYSDKIQQMGYQSLVIEASNGYYRVSAKSFTSYQQGINEIADFRAGVSPGAWLHVRN